MRQLVSVDLGYGYVKGVSSTGKRILFPTMIAAGHERKLMTIFGGSNVDNMNNLHARIQGVDYFLGDLAREARTYTRLFDRERHNHPYTQIILQAAVSLLVEEEVDSVVLVTGLPLDFYQSQASEFRRALQGMNIDVQWVAGPLKGQSRKLTVEQVYVFPQGAGAIFVALVDEGGKPIYPELMAPGIQVGLIDIGHRTTDYVVVEMAPNGSMIPKSEWSGTIDEGILELYRQIRHAYKQQTGGADLSDHQVERILHTGTIHFRGKRIVLQDQIQVSKNNLASNLADRVKAAWGQASDFFDAIFICGGGGDLLFPSLQMYFDHRLHKMYDSQFANAVGYLRLGAALVSHETVRNIAAAQ